MQNLTLNLAKTTIEYLEKERKQGKLTQVQLLQRALIAQMTLNVGSDDPGIQKLSDFLINDFPALSVARIPGKGFPVTDKIVARTMTLPWGAVELSLDGEDIARLMRGSSRSGKKEKTE